MKKLIALAFAIAVLVTPFLACGSTAGGSTGTAVTPTDNSSSGSTPTQAAKVWHMGDTVSIGNWTVKVNSFKTNTGGEFDAPKAGNIYVVADITLKNTSSSPQDFSSLISFSFKDSTGQTYTETVVSGVPNSPNGNVAAGALLRGSIVYEVPKTQKSFSLSFTPDIGSSDLATWNLTVK